MKMLVLNHKMNLNYDDIKIYIGSLKKYKDKLIVMPSSIYAKDFIDNGFNTGLQNIFYQDKGMYTGEISAVQAKSLGCKYVLIGHSERRKVFKETDEIINKKIKSALKNDLRVILCVGDDFNEEVHKTLYKQLTEALKGISENVIIAYEPVYAIGTGIIPEVEDIKERIAYIKSLVNTKVLYGGSINSNNIKQLNMIDNLDGYLIGLSSLEAFEVVRILEVVE